MFPYSVRNVLLYVSLDVPVLADLIDGVVVFYLFFLALSAFVC